MTSLRTGQHPDGTVSQGAGLPSHSRSDQTAVQGTAAVQEALSRAPLNRAARSLATVGQDATERMLMGPQDERSTLTGLRLADDEVTRRGESKKLDETRGENGTRMAKGSRSIRNSRQGHWQRYVSAAYGEPAPSRPRVLLATRADVARAAAVGAGVIAIFLVGLWMVGSLTGSSTQSAPLPGNTLSPTVASEAAPHSDRSDGVAAGVEVDLGQAAGSVTAEGAGDWGTQGASVGTSLGEDSSEATQPDQLMWVHVAGAVTRPGVVRLTAGSRVKDAVEAAAGFTDSADPHQINLAAVVSDGGYVFIPAQGQTIADSPLPITHEKEAESQVGSGSAALVAQSSGVRHTGVADPDQINLNQASAAELEQLNGIGPALAGRIIAYRDQHGRFNDVEELLQVSGIGPSVFTRIRDQITL